MLSVRTVLKPSSIHGLGVFAEEPITKGQRVWEAEHLLDVILTPRELERLPQVAQDYIRHHGHTAKNLMGMILVDFGNGKYMNHSDNPNTDFRTETGYALCDIAAGEEMTCNYAEYEADDISFHTFYKP